MEEVKLGRTSKLFFAAFFGLIVCSLAVLYWHTIVLEEYTIFIPEELGGEAQARDVIPHPENLDL